MMEIYEFLRSLWVVWLMAIFLAIVIYVMWPSRRKKYQDAAMIPLKDDPSTTDKERG